MAVCDRIDWRMTLTNDDSGKGFEEFIFKITRIIDTLITGEVFNLSGTKLSDLTGTCEALGIGDPLLTRVTFQFSLPGSTRVGVFLAGLGFVPLGQTKAQFIGRLRAYAPDAFTPSLVDAVTTGSLRLDVGDTGTGNGMQT